MRGSEGAIHLGCVMLYVMNQSRKLTKDNLITMGEQIQTAKIQINFWIRSQYNLESVCISEINQLKSCNQMTVETKLLRAC